MTGLNEVHRLTSSFALGAATPTSLPQQLSRVGTGWKEFRVLVNVALRYRKILAKSSKTFI